MFLLSTASLRGYGLHKIFKLAKEAGYEGVCLDLDPANFDTENVEYVKSVSESFGMPVASVTAYERKMDTDTVVRVAELAKSLGAKTVNFYPPHRLDKDVGWFNEDLAKIAANHKEVTFAIVNVEPKTILFFIPEYKDATLSSIKKLTGKTTLSVSNVDPETGTDLMKTFTHLGNTITNVLLSDRTGAKADLLPGRGDAPLESLLIKLRELGYKGDFTLKVAPKELSAGDDDAVLKKLAEAKAYFEKHYPVAAK